MRAGVALLAKRVKLNQLGAAVSEILEEYADSVYDATERAVELCVKTGTREVRAASPVKKGGGGGKYRAGWRNEVVKNRISTEGVIYNAKYPGLTHLLEHGHAKVIGGRRYPDPVPGIPHIGPIQDKLDKLIEEKIKVYINGI